MNGIKSISPESNSLSFGELSSTYSVGWKDTYVLNSCTNNEKFATALSNYTATVYDDHNNQIAEYVHNNAITGIKFSSQDPSLLFTSSLDGKINVWDSRCNEAVQTFLDTSSGLPKPLLCFDYSLDEMFVCAGTELIREDSFLVFWDRRSSKCLGGYWDGHTDDISQVQFHPSVNSCMASASLDGLINVYDLNKGSEDEALTSTLNVGNAINKLSWIDTDFLSCITTLEEYQLWSINEPSPIRSVKTEDFSKDLKCNIDYIIDTLKIAKYWYVATGSKDGTVHLSCINGKNLEPAGCLSSGHTDVVRTICYNSKVDMIITGAEEGKICKWENLCRRA